MKRTPRTVKRADTKLEFEFDLFLETLAPELPKPEKNYRFDEPDSKMEIDRFWVDEGIGVELNGGTFARGKQGHSSGVGIDRDYRKLAAAHQRGIKLFFFSSNMVRRDPEWCIDQLRPFIGLPFAEKLKEETR